MAQTINLPVGQAANLNVTLTSDDNTVYMGLPSVIVAGVDIAANPGPPPLPFYPETGFLYKGTVKLGTGLGGSYTPVGSYPNGIAATTYGETSNALTTPGTQRVRACGGASFYAGIYYYAAEGDIRPFNYTITTNRNAVTATGDTRQGVYTHYLVKPIYDLQSCYFVGSNLTIPFTFLGYCYRRLDFTIVDPTVVPPAPCLCCNWTADSGPPQMAWTADSGPACGAWEIVKPCDC